MDSELISYRRSPVRPIGTKEKIQKDGMCHVLLEKLECLPQKIYYRNENRKAQKRYGEKLADKLIMRKKAFANSREKIRHSEVVTEDTIEEKLGNKYDWYVSGSDQIWKPGVLQNPYECWERCYPYSWKSGLYLRFAEERSEVYCNHAVCCGASHVL